MYNNNIFINFSLNAILIDITGTYWNIFAKYSYFYWKYVWNVQKNNVLPSRGRYEYEKVT